MLFNLVCQACHKGFESVKETQRYCSYKCSNISRGYFFKNKIYCHWCQSLITRPSPSKCHKFCSKKCEMDYKRKDRVEIKCHICKKKWFVNKSNSKKKYCSRKCMGVAYQNNPKRYKIQYRSYGECAMVCLLRKNYPNLKIIPNDREQLNGYEIDIWLPELNIGIEYNGQHHFKPVYGKKVFQKTLLSDKNKLMIACKKGIKLVYVIPKGSVFITNKTKIKELFIKCCNDIGLTTPTIFNVLLDEVRKEQNGKIPQNQRFINLGRKWSLKRKQKFSKIRLKTYVLKSPSNKIINVYNLSKFCKKQHIQYTYMISRFKKRKPCKGWMLQ